MQGDVKSFVKNFARGMTQQRSAARALQDPERRTEQVRELGVEAVAKALDKHGFPKRGLARLAS